MTLEDFDVASDLAEPAAASAHGDLLPTFAPLQSLLRADADHAAPPADLLERTLAYIAARSTQA